MKKICVTVMSLMIVAWLATYIVAMELKDIDRESPGVWGVEGVELSQYIPEVGGIKVCKAEKQVIVGFKLSQRNIDFYSQAFADGTRKPMGFEIDIYDHDGVFHRDNIIDISTTFSESARYDDNYMLDNDDKLYTLGINNPTRLGVGWHYAIFYFSDYVDVSLATFEVGVQLMGDICALEAKNPEVAANYSAYVQAQFIGWFSTAGLSDSDGNNFFCLGTSNQMFKRNEFFGWPEGLDTGYDRVIWKIGKEGEKRDYKPYSCDFGSDPWESSDDGDDNSNNNSSGSSTGGSDTGSGDGYNDTTDNNPDSNSHDSGGSDLSISNCYLSIAGKDDWKHQINKTLTYGHSFQIEAEGRVRNESNSEAKDVDWDWRVDGGKKNFDRDDRKIDEEKELDIDPNSKVKKHLGRSTVKLSSDGKTVTITGPKGSKSFSVQDDGKCKFYIFIDVENDDDDDISSRDSSKHEYGVVEITAKKPNYQPKGYLDSANCSTVNGWAKDPNTVNPIDIHFYADGNSNTGTFVGSIKANGYRSDLPYTDKYHGYSFSVPEDLKDGNLHTIYVYAIDSQSGYNPLLGTTQMVCAQNRENIFPAYRMYSSSHQSHLYTISEGEKDGLLTSNWLMEGVGFWAHSQPESDTVPVYRFYRSNKGHFLTASFGEKFDLMYSDDWNYEGVVFQAYNWHKDGTAPVYRMYSSQKQSHFYTISWSEVQSAIQISYAYEGIAFYAFATLPPPDYNELSNADRGGISDVYESLYVDTNNDGVSDQNDSDQDDYSNQQDNLIGADPLNENSAPDGPAAVQGFQIGN